jgi:hypothetical protein
VNGVTSAVPPAVQPAAPATVPHAAAGSGNASETPAPHAAATSWNAGGTSAPHAAGETPGVFPPPLPPDSPYGPYAVYYAEPDKVTQFFGKVNRRTPRWIAPVALAATCVAASAYVLWSNPTDGGAADTPGCLVRLTTGFDCPGCGGTRAAWYLLHGDLAAAAQHHLVFVFALPFLLYAYAVWAAGALFNKQLPKLRVSYRTLAVALGVWAVFSVLRNLPFEPFSWFYV